MQPARSYLAQWRARKPLLAFRARNREEWQWWRRRFRQAILRELGPAPEPVPLRAQVLERTDCGDHVREKVVFDSERFMSVPAWVLLPKGLKRGQKVPGILCAHGHGRGKDALVGLTEGGQPLEDVHHQYALQSVRHGYVCVAPDWRTFGERADTDEWVRRPTRDGCNVAYLGAGYFGYHLLRLQIWDGQRTLDYLQSRPEVDARRIGCIGLSFGGTMTTYLTALDQRIKCCVISGYLSTLEDGLERSNFCGSQYMPGLAKYGDISEVATLIAPRPLLAEIGEKDTCFLVDDALKAYRRVERAYRVIGAKERVEVDLFPGGHEFSGRKAFDWFERWLGVGVRG